MVFIILRGSLILLRRLLTSLLILSLMLQQGLPAFAHSPSFLSLTKIDEITSDKITGALDATMSVDNRVFTGAGWVSIASDVTNFGSNLVDATKGAGKGAVYTLGVFGDVLASIGETFTGTAGLDPTDLPKLVAVKVGVQQTLAELPKTCPECMEWINGKNFDLDKSAEIEKTIAETARIHGLSMSEFRLYAMPDGKGGMQNSAGGGSVAINMLNRDGSGFSSGEQRAFSVGHEAGGHNSGIADGESFADLMGHYALGAMDLSNWLNGNDRITDAGSAKDWLAQYGDSEYVKGNNAWAKDLADKPGTDNWMLRVAPAQAIDSYVDLQMQQQLSPEEYAAYREQKDINHKGFQLALAEHMGKTIEIPTDERLLAAYQSAKPVVVYAELMTLQGLGEFANLAYHLSATPAKVGAGEYKKDDYSHLSGEDQKSIRSYIRRIEEHQQKIADFKDNPTVRPGMENLSQEAIQAQQASRINHFEKEIRTFTDNINKILKKYPGK